jgi:F420H(2)-dependent quinone reductase
VCASLRGTGTREHEGRDYDERKGHEHRLDTEFVAKPAHGQRLDPSLVGKGNGAAQHPFPAEGVAARPSNRTLSAWVPGAETYNVRLDGWSAGGRPRVSANRARAARVPPRWFIRFVWSAHRAVCRVSGGRVGLWRPKRGRWGTARLTTTGRRTGQQRSVIVGHVEDGPNLITLVMNGWADPEPAWWLNLQAHPDAIVDLATGSRVVRARAAEGAERSCLWARWREIDERLDAYAAGRSSATAVVVLKPRSVPS